MIAPPLVLKHAVLFRVTYGSHITCTRSPAQLCALAAAAQPKSKVQQGKGITKRKKISVKRGKFSTERCNKRNKELKQAKKRREALKAAQPV